MVDKISKVTKDEIESAWKYLDGADSMLHSRMNSLLICQAFLVVAYVQVLSSQTFSEKAFMPMAGFIVVFLGYAITRVVFGSIVKLQKGGDEMKKYLNHDPIYYAYLQGVRGGDKRKWLTSYTSVVPTFFMWFWVALMLLLTFAVLVGFYGLDISMKFGV